MHLHPSTHCYTIRRQEGAAPLQAHETQQLLPMLLTNNCKRCDTPPTVPQQVLQLQKEVHLLFMVQLPLAFI
jgi:hypothetical protein